MRASYRLRPVKARMPQAYHLHCLNATLASTIWAPAHRTGGTCPPWKSQIREYIVSWTYDKKRIEIDLGQICLTQVRLCEKANKTLVVGDTWAGRKRSRWKQLMIMNSTMQLTEKMCGYGDDPEGPLHLFAWVKAANSKAALGAVLPR